MNIQTVSLYIRKRHGIEPAVIEVSVITEKMKACSPSDQRML
ncbi:hypothetical protein SAMN05216464_111130 [Mucilaginibacter pineti]|uniref:Uncharacterized protein n=1 Tax=Mucilaginibacter pineti TaxID=1391627 RepID=A0A1G7H9V3_9SPHI|nr:hypothetical protein SAMN05216464_111130 [Mucilaginibacter pineti]